MAEALGHDVVFSRKPNPTLISTAKFNEERSAPTSGRHSRPPATDKTGR